jgi:hypothetical protein
MSISDVKKYFIIWAVHYLSGDKPVPVWRVSRYKHLPFCLWMQNYDCKIRDVKYASKRAAMIYPLYIEKGCCSYRAISQKAILLHLIGYSSMLSFRNEQICIVRSPQRTTFQGNRWLFREFLQLSRQYQRGNLISIGRLIVLYLSPTAEF